MFLGSPNGSFKSEPYRKPASVHYSGDNELKKEFRVFQNPANSWFSAPICQVLLQKNLTDCRGAPILSAWEDASHRQKAQAGSWPSSASRSNAAANGCGALTTSGTCPSRPSPRPSRA